MAKYKYETLADPAANIRLLMLQNGQQDEPLRAKLEHTPMDDRVSYEAVSYSWGSPSETCTILKHTILKYITLKHTIQVEKSGSYFSLAITPNLDNVLRRFRRVEDVRALWIDAVCIDQGTKEEKSAQVGIMDSIYASAQQVLVYLGEPSASTAQAIALLDQIYAAPSNAPPINSDKQRQWINDNQLPTVLEPQRWAPLKEFFCRPWFRRKWIIQETVLARKLIFHCGEWERDWNFMQHVRKNIQDNGLAVLDHTTCPTLLEGAEVQQSLSQLNWIITLRDCLSKNEKLHLMDLAYIFRYSRATDPRDHLFALLGVGYNVTDPILKPRYKKIDTILDTCIRYARYFLARTRNLEVLYRAGLNGHRLLAPSWIPDWYGGHETLTLGHAEGFWDPLRRPSSYHVAPGTVPELHWSDNATELGVKGTIIDTIENLANQYFLASAKEPLDKDLLLRRKREHLDESRIINDALPGRYPTGQDARDVHWRTLICNMTHDLSPAPAEADEAAYREYRMSYEVWRHHLLWKEGMVPIDPQYLPVRHLFRQIIDDYNGDKIFGSTKENYLGMFPQFAQKGDMIAVLHGGEFPFVLRRVERQEKMYQLVGQCYLHGLMEGELNLKDEKYETEIIWLEGDFEKERSLLSSVVTYLQILWTGIVQLYGMVFRAVTAVGSRKVKSD
ncbi:hypothetical protein LTR64_002725 [Lithohypha guttulata]|uniref:uncharacterized protein n=1 Tax=Lithohypha guttulata TaxID=1690604 RepID=UPI00315DF2DE